jgi:Spy/CpxP family protein refolding chaperone
MKTKLSILVTANLLALAISPLFAQDQPKPEATPGASGGPGGPEGWGRRGMMQGLQNLTPEEKEKLKAAREKAMQDPKVQDAQENMKAANEVFRAARKQALLAQDPTLGPILDKLEAGQKPVLSGSQGGTKTGPPERGGRRPDLSVLTPEEREKLKAANEKIKDNPDVVSAREKAMEANKQFFSAMHDAMLAADPSIEPILKKAEAGRLQNQGRREGGQPPPKP